MQRIVVLLLGFVNILVQYYDVPSLKLGHYSNLIWMKKIEKICYSISNTNSNVQYSNIVWKFEFKIQIQIRNSIKNSKLFENNIISPGLPGSKNEKSLILPQAF